MTTLLASLVSPFQREVSRAASAAGMSFSGTAHTAKGKEDTFRFIRVAGAAGDGPRPGSWFRTWHRS